MSNINDPSYYLTYPGKQSQKDILGRISKPLIELTRFSQISNPWFNRLIWGDNIDALLNLVSEFAKKIHLIYIDPPFSTNSSFSNKEFDHAYDDFRTGTEYIEFIRERLIILYELLADDGSIYVHLDNKMIFEIKVIMDEIFGSSNFRNCITRKKCNRKNYTKNQYGNISDYILFYTKSDTYIWNRPSDIWLDDDITREFPCIDNENGRRYKKVPIHAPGIRNGETGKSWRGMMPPKGKHWQYIPSKLDELDSKGDIYWSSTGNPRRKHYFDDDSALPAQDIWLEYKDIVNQNTIMTGYPTEKNPLLLDRIISASSNPGDLVMDCFAGSGTTIARAELLDRRWIGIDVGLLSIKTILSRITTGSKALKDLAPEKEEKYLYLPMNTNPECIKTNLILYQVNGQNPDVLKELIDYAMALKETFLPTSVM